MPKVVDVLPDAIRRNDSRIVSGCVDALRFKCRMNYDQIYEFAKKLVPELTPQQWGNLMYEADMEQP